MNLIWVNWGVKDPPYSIKRVGNDYYIIGIEVDDSLIYAASNSK